MAHEAPEMVIASRPASYPFSWFWSPTAILRIRESPMKEKEVPFANCPPPDYITGFRYIQI
jgi:hypothetical protein